MIESKEEKLKLIEKDMKLIEPKIELLIIDCMYYMKGCVALPVLGRC